MGAPPIMPARRFWICPGPSKAATRGTVQQWLNCSRAKEVRGATRRLAPASRAGSNSRTPAKTWAQGRVLRRRLSASRSNAGRWVSTCQIKAPKPRPKARLLPELAEVHSTRARSSGSSSATEKFSAKTLCCNCSPVQHKNREGRNNARRR